MASKIICDICEKIKSLGESIEHNCPIKNGVIFEDDL